MLTSDLTITSNASSITLPGSAGATTFALRSIDGGRATRVVAATANTTPQTCVISHRVSGSGYKATIDSLISNRIDIKNVDPTLTGGVVPFCLVQIKIVRPENSGGAITDAVIQTTVGGALHVLLASGQLAKLMNQEV